MDEVTFRPARPADHEGVRALCADVWPDRESDYLPEVYPEWVRGPDKHTILGEADGTVVCLAQAVMLSDREAWLQGLRVDPQWSGRGLGARLTADLFGWAREQGAVVARNMIFSWNVAGMGHARTQGFEPATAFRWAFPDVEAAEMPAGVVRSGAAAWTAWTDSDARTHLRGLGADLGESWALSECREELVHELAADGGTLAIVDDGLRGMTLRGRSYVPAGETDETGQEYAVAAWTDADAARAVLAAAAADAAEHGARAARVVVPETVRHVSDVAYAGATVDEAPHFVLEADLLAVGD